MVAQNEGTEPLRAESHGSGELLQIRRRADLIGQIQIVELQPIFIQQRHGGVDVHGGGVHNAGEAEKIGVVQTKDHIDLAQILLHAHGVAEAQALEPAEIHPHALGEIVPQFLVQSGLVQTQQQLRPGEALLQGCGIFREIAEAHQLLGPALLHRAVVLQGGEIVLLDDGHGLFPEKFPHQGVRRLFTAGGERQQHHQREKDRKHSGPSFHLGTLLCVEFGRNYPSGHITFEKQKSSGIREKDASDTRKLYHSPGGLTSAGEERAQGL